MRAKTLNDVIAKRVYSTTFIKAPLVISPTRGPYNHCANLIGTSWHLVAQHATSVSASLIKLRVSKLHSCFGSRGSEVQILSPRPFKIMGYGLGRSPFFVVASAGASVWYGVGDSLPGLVCASSAISYASITLNLERGSGNDYWFIT